MGLAASQARLLTITARLADNELRSQTINNAKMRLATQSAQASDEYVSALNNAQLMFTNKDSSGLTQNQALTFNSLTQYGQYNNQYGIVNSAGQILVSEEDAAIFENSGNNLETFLEAHGLSWETTFFHSLDTDGQEIDLSSRLVSFYSGDNSYIANLLNRSNDELETMYLQAISQDSSIENLNYKIYAQNYYQEAIMLYENTVPEFRNDIVDESSSEVTEETIAAKFKELYGNGNNDAIVRKELKNGQINPAGAKGTDGNMGSKPAAYAFDSIRKYLTGAGEKKLLNFINSFRDEVYPTTGKATATWYESETNVSGPSSTDIDLTYYERENGTPNYGDDGKIKDYSYPSGGTGKEPYIYISKGQYNISQGDIYTCGKIKIVIDEPVPINDSGYDLEHPNRFETRSYIKVDSEDWRYGNSSAYNEDTELSINPGDVDTKYLMDLISEIKYKETEPDDKAENGTDEFYRAFQVSEDENNNKDYQSLIVSSIYNDDRTSLYEEFVTNYLHMILNNSGYFNPDAYASENEGVPTLKDYQDSKNKFINEYGFSPSSYDCLIDFDKLIKSGSYGSTPSFISVLNSWLVDKMLDVLGEPKYAWVDSTDPNNVGNADAKAQWLTNLFNRMQKGYKVLENGLAKSNQWLEYAFESGLVSMEQVDLSYNWVSLDYKSCASIYEETDNSATVSKAEAKYNRAMNDIKQKDSMFDLQLKNIDTEHTSLQTEYDVIKNVMKNNIERTMKFDQSA